VKGSTVSKVPKVEGSGCHGRRKPSNVQRGRELERILFSVIDDTPGLPSIYSHCKVFLNREEFDRVLLSVRNHFVANDGKNKKKFIQTAAAVPKRPLSLPRSHLYMVDAG